MLIHEAIAPQFGHCGLFAPSGMPPSTRLSGQLSMHSIPVASSHGVQSTGPNAGSYETNLLAAGVASNGGTNSSALA
jgi:hypothetical protein